MCYQVSYGYIDIGQKTVNKGSYINVKGEYANVSLDFTYEKNLDKVIFGIIHAWYSILFLFF
jgi:hypothetical protein